MSVDAVESAWKESRSPEERDDISSFVWRRPDRFRLGNVAWETGLDYSESHRWVTVYPEDYLFARAVYDELWSVRKPVFRLNDIIKLTSNRPDIPALNGHLLGPRPV
jgi:spore coat polysaccharide biosynthesis protein SpsF